MTTTPRDTHARQDADGTVYLAYFVPEHQAGFCWSGDPSQPVEVCYGGMGEPVAEQFRFDTVPLQDRRALIQTVMHEFKRQCDAFLTNTQE